MKIRAILAATLLFACTLLVATPAAQAADTVTCDVTVAETLIAVSVSTSTVSFGPVGLGEEAVSGTYELENTGNVWESIYVRGTDPVNDFAGTWSLGFSQGEDQVVVQQHGDIPEMVYLETVPVVFVGGPPAVLCTGLQLALYMPTSTTLAGTYSFDVIYTAVEITD